MSNDVLYEQELIKLASNNSLSHAIILESKNIDISKKIALKVAQTLLCTSDAQRPCGECINCVKCIKETHTDVQLISAENTSSLKVETIRNIRSDAYVVSNEGGCKIYIISDADVMTVQSQNAFIKILEEPPKDVFFIILCKSQMSLLNTVRSRCCIYRLTSEEVIDDLSQLASKIVDFSINNDKIEVMRQIALLDNNRENFKQLIEKISENFINKIAQGCVKNSVSDTLVILDNLRYVFNQVDKNVNLNLLKSYVLAWL